MSFLSLVGVEFKKIKRSKILLILLVATVILWVPSILNAQMNFDMQAEGISPENNFFIQYLNAVARPLQQLPALNQNRTFRVG